MKKILVALLMVLWAGSAHAGQIFKGQWINEKSDAIIKPTTTYSKTYTLSVADEDGKGEFLSVPVDNGKTYFVHPTVDTYLYSAGHVKEGVHFDTTGNGSYTGRLEYTDPGLGTLADDLDVPDGQDVTWEFWLTLDSDYAAPASNVRIFRDINAAGGWALYINSSPHRWWFHLEDGTNSVDLNGPTGLTANTVYHIVVTLTNNTDPTTDTAKLYINSTAAAASNSTVSLASMVNSVNLLIGNNESDFILHAFRIYDRVPTSTELTEMFSAYDETVDAPENKDYPIPTSMVANLVANYDFSHLIHSGNTVQEHWYDSAVQGAYSRDNDLRTAVLPVGVDTTNTSTDAPIIYDATSGKALHRGIPMSAGGDYLIKSFGTGFNFWVDSAAGETGQVIVQEVRP